MYREARRVIGRFTNNDGGAINVACTKTYGGRDPFEVILMRYSENTVNAEVIHRVVVDWIESNQAQGQNRGLHGEGNFTKSRIKDLRMTVNPRDFSSAGGRNYINLDFVIKEFRFPESSGELLLDPGLRLIYTSTYTFSGLEGSLNLKVVVNDANGDTLLANSYEQVDRIDRKYGVTTNRGHKLPNQREVKLDDSDVIVREVENGSLANSRGNNDDEFTISDSQDHLFLSRDYCLMKSKQKRKGVVADLPPPDPGPSKEKDDGGQNIQPDYDTLIGCLRAYLEVLSDSDGSTRSTDLQGQGSVLLERVEGAYSDPNSISIEDLENVLRSFLRNCEDFEWSKSGEVSKKMFSKLQLEGLKFLSKFAEVQTNEDRDGDDKKKDSFEANTNPETEKSKKRSLKVKFVDPLKQAKLLKLECPHCDREFRSANIKPLQLHIRQDHKDKENVSTNNFQEEESKFECLLQKKNGNKCGGRFTRDQLFRHMQSKKLHKNPQKAPKGKKFRGWFKPEDKDYAVSAVFKAVNESNPNSDEEIELDVESLEKSLAETREQIKSKKQPGTNVKLGEDEDSIEAPQSSGATSSALENSKENAVDSSHLDSRSDDKPDDDLMTEEPMIQPTANNLSVVENVANAANSQDLVECIVVPEHGPHAFLIKAQEAPDKDSIEQDQFEVIGNVNVPDINSPQQKIFDENPSNNDPVGEAGSGNVIVMVPDIVSTQQIILDSEADANIWNTENSNAVNPVTHSEEQTFFEENPENDYLIGDRLLSSVAITEEPTEVGEFLDFDVPSASQVCKEKQINVKKVRFADEEDKELVSFLEDQTSQNSIQESMSVAPLCKVTDKFFEPLIVSVCNPKEHKNNNTFWVNPGLVSVVPPDTVNEDIGNSILQTADDNIMQEMSGILEVTPAEADASVEDSDLLTDYDSEDSEDEFEVDSDYDEDRDIDYEMTKIRQERKMVRRLNRDSQEETEDLPDLPQNKAFINLFMDWFRSTTGLSTANTKCSTIRHTQGHAFYHHDSFLRFMCSEDTEFNLGKLIDFQSDEFQFIQSPVAWILKAKGTGSGNPSRSAEQLKIHARLRRFISYMMLRANMGSRNVLHKMAITQHLNEITSEIKEQKFFKKLKKQHDLETAKLKKMKGILSTHSTDHVEYNAVKIWNNSQRAQDLEKEFNKTHEKAMMSKKPLKPLEFNKCSNFARFFVAIRDKNRPSCYGFTNGDFWSKVPAWLPDVDKYIWRIDDLPENWQLYHSPSPNTPPSCWEIRLDGSQVGVKGQRQTNIIIDRLSFDVMVKYEQIKKAMSPKLEANAPFFINHRQKPLSRIQKSRGSLVEQFGQVIGKEDFTMTSIRRAAEGKIQSDKNLAGLTSDLNNHSEAVVNVYDNISSARRNIFITSIGADEKSSAASSNDDEFRRIYEESKKNEEETSNKLKDEARRCLDEHKKKAKSIVDFSATSLPEDEVEFLKEKFSKEDTKGDWSKSFYWMVDSLSPDEGGSKLRKIESKIFWRLRGAILKELGVRKWKGTKDQNKFAEEKVSSIIKQALE